jgi:hypothetical protein
MRPEDRLKRKAARVRRPYKTKGDFLRWLRKKDAHRKQAAQEESTQADRAILKALMVWADDGGTSA